MKHHDVGHADLARQQDVLARLRHRAVGGGLTTRIAPSICAAPVIMFLT
jgi:chorismate mutase